ncbi:hypothetical protein PINS_up013740 [Pythium insidiosum]|nr:hypothetical protein PINS_up013740 [Pythium insidiosum]
MSQLISPEHPLSFELDQARDRLHEVLQVEIRFDTMLSIYNEKEDVVEDGSISLRGASSDTPSTRERAQRGRPKLILDPDSVVDSDAEEAGDPSAGDDGYDAVSDAESDVSLEPFDLEDDEEDLQPERPRYIKDLLLGLNAEDDNREKVEAALAEAEALMRRKPKDLHFRAKDVVVALLRLEDKFSTPDFLQQRARALAAAAALAPHQTIPYLQSQALEREQLLQSRLDSLQAMVVAAQELSEMGEFRIQGEKRLLQENLDARTMQSLKTRRWGYRRDVLVPAKRNAFGELALSFFTPLLFGYVEYVRKHYSPPTARYSDIDNLFLAHLLHALACFVECAGNAPAAIPMAKSLLDFAWHQRMNSVAAVRRQVLFAVSRVLLVTPPFILRQDLSAQFVEIVSWLRETGASDTDEGCREATRLLLSSSALPMLSIP